MNLLWLFGLSQLHARAARLAAKGLIASISLMKPQRIVYSPTRSRRLNEMFGLIVLVAAGLLLLALISYTPSDPSFNTVGGGAGTHPAHNWTGLVGAYTADLLLQTLGIAIFFVPLALLRIGVSWMRSRRVGSATAKVTGILLWLTFAPAMIALLPGHALWRHSVPISGVEGGILAGGRTGLLYKELVRDKQIALEAGADDTFPGGKYPNLFVFSLAPAAGHTTAENEKALDEVLEKFKSQKVDDVTLARVKTKTRAGLIRRLDSNPGLAGLLTAYHAIYGDWRKLFTSLDELDRITADDVQRVAKECFVPEKRTVAYLVAPKQAAGGAQ